MNALHSHLGPADCDVVEEIADALQEEGFAIVPNALPAPITEGLFQRVLDLGDHAFSEAGVGRQIEHHLNPFVRRDRIRWLDAGHPAERAFLTWMEELRKHLNEQLFLGLFDCECHFAQYPPGAFYKRHVDAFHGHTSRLVSTVLYLNPGWTTDDGGELLLYRINDESPFLRVSPIFGTLAVFLSEEFPHEVVNAYRHRYSVAGWFRVNGSETGRVDPPR